MAGSAEPNYTLVRCTNKKAMHRYQSIFMQANHGINQYSGVDYPFYRVFTWMLKGFVFIRMSLIPNKTSKSPYTIYLRYSAMCSHLIRSKAESAADAEKIDRFINFGVDNRTFWLTRNACIVNQKQIQLLQFECVHVLPCWLPFACFKFVGAAESRIDCYTHVVVWASI